jgi:hypothetical protein
MPEPHSARRGQGHTVRGADRGDDRDSSGKRMSVSNRPPATGLSVKETAQVDLCLGVLT